MKNEVFYLLGCKGDGCSESHYSFGQSVTKIKACLKHATSPVLRESIQEIVTMLTPEEESCYDWVRCTNVANLLWWCPNCHSPYDDARQIDIRIDESEHYLAKQKPLTFASYSPIKIVWEPFIRAIPSHILDRDMYFGDVIGPDGKRIEGWLTYRCRYYLQFRGTGKGGTSPCKVTVCKDCGYVRWFAHSPHFIYPAPPEDADIFQYGYSTMFRESIYQYLDMEQWRKKVYVTKIKVADKPLDGLDLPQYAIPRDLKWVAEHPELERC